MPTYIKSFGIKASTAGAEITPEVLAEINQYALKALTAEELYARRFILAHNAVDRDRERFPESILDDFAETLPGKSFLLFHKGREYLPLGLFFKTATEDVPSEKFKELTGEDPLLPEGVDQVRVLWAWMYMLKEGQEGFIRNMDAGIYRHVSIGFNAADCIPVKGEFDQTMYWEYVPPGEATEGSIVWLGAQTGATVQKASDGDQRSEIRSQKNIKGEQKNMKELLIFLGQLLGKSFDENTTAQSAISSIKEAFQAKDTEVEDLQKKLVELESLAAEGKTYRGHMVDEYARLKAALGECDETPEAAEQIKTFAKGFDISFLQAEIKHLETRLAEKFPDKGQLPGDAGDKKRDKADDNPLIPEENK